MGYYVKDDLDIAKEKARVLKQKAKITKFGKCSRHEGHFAGDWYVCGFVSAIILSLMIIIPLDNIRDTAQKNLVRAQEANQELDQSWRNNYTVLNNEYQGLNEKWKKLYLDKPMKTVKAKGIHYHCIDKSGKALDGLAAATLSFPEESVNTTKQCTFDVQY